MTSVFSFSIESQCVGQAPSSTQNSTNFDWLIPVLNSSALEVQKVEPTDYLQAGGMIAHMKKIKVHYINGSSQLFVLKSMPEAGQQRSKELGLVREAFFYTYLAPHMRAHGVNVAQSTYCYGDFTTGAKSILLEDLNESSIQSGYFFGGGSPLNWGKDLTSLISREAINGDLSNISTPIDISKDAFINAARMHALFWNDHNLLQTKWIRATEWLKNENHVSWLASQNHAAEIWNKTKSKILDGQSKVAWSPHVLECMDKSISLISWEVYQQELKDRPWTLVHGDFHPANIMWKINDNKDNFSNSSRSVLLDWEAVGVGSGPQDIAQYLISHMDPITRKENENELVQIYYNTLISTVSDVKSLVDDSIEQKCRVDSEKYKLEDCWYDYRQGGVRRWVWLLALLSGMCPDPMVQYFHDQLEAFMIDHNVTTDNIGMPRV
eukprot:gene5120-7133_t